MVLDAFERRLGEVGSRREVASRAVNDSASVLAFEQAVLWWVDVRSKRIAFAATGLSDIASGSSYEQWLRHLVEAITPDPFDTVQALADLPAEVAAEGAEWFPGHLLHCPVRAPAGAALGGMLFFRPEGYTDAERKLAQSIADATGRALAR